ncbi:hypothetical protein Dda_2443 [Drechslerella dactyloides]|uniref:F-box domain-containing protein n=1 Tax=Drechslerella dactyloides TaxID=74499 RepID=A0AAD6J1U0_DREDA|nr:hypothetical protein Dda_2443 [Drechslerella dactyloides]
MATTRALLDLPHELLHQIFLSVDPDDLAALQLTCSSLDRYVKGNELLLKALFLQHWDEPTAKGTSALGSTWEKRLHNAVWLQKILESDSPDSKLNDYQKVVETIVALLQVKNLDNSRSLSFLTDYFEGNKLNIDTLLCRSSLFEAVGDSTRVAADTEFERQLSAKLHCYYGVPIDPRGKKRKPTHPCARSKVYDLRNYDANTMWGPFRADGSGRVDWEKMEAIMIVLAYNMNLTVDESDPAFGAIWTVKFRGAVPYSGPFIEPTIVDEIDPPLEAADPYGVTGTWLRVVCFLDYHDFHAFNFSSAPPPDGVPRGPIEIPEALRFIKLGIRITKIEPPGPDDGQDLPVVHFRGVSRLIDAYWDPNANSLLTGEFRRLLGLLGNSNFLVAEPPDDFRYIGTNTVTPITSAEFKRSLIQRLIGRKGGEAKVFKWAVFVPDEVSWEHGSTKILIPTGPQAQQPFGKQAIPLSEAFYPTPTMTKLGHHAPIAAIVKIIMEESFDIVIVGAGVSGVSAAYRVQNMLPDKTFIVLERREQIGGTWDIFKYPGVRSDTDLIAYGFPFAPWSGENLIGSGEQILNYVRRTAAMHSIDQRVRFKHAVSTAEWSSDDKEWKLTVSTGNSECVIHAKYIIWASGYYDHAQGLSTAIPGIENFAGTVVHPQFWPQDLDYANKQVVIIGSGATAVTILPAMVDSAAHVTMLQRSPSFVLTVPTQEPENQFMERYLPAWLSSRLIRWKHLLIARILVEVCLLFPNFARSTMRKVTTRLLPAHIPHDPHFEPRYNMWEQRVCLTPDGDFFKALHTNKASIVTDTIKMVSPTGIELGSGNRLDADIIITATGLKLQLFGGAQILLDGRPLQAHEKYVWNGTMLQDVPNASLLMGYTAFPWTPGVDIMGQLAIRLIKMMDRRGARTVTPRVDSTKELKPAPLLDITSTYFMSSAHYMPKAGDRGPWRRRTGYFEDVWKVKYGNLAEEMVFE